jgi:hypothetical protein
MHMTEYSTNYILLNIFKFKLKTPLAMFFFPLKKN